MNRNLMIAGVVAGVLVIGGIIYAVTRPSTSVLTPSTPSASSDTTTPSTSDTTSSSDVATSVTITYTDNGFSPASVTVKAGGTVTVVNNSSGSLQFSSNPHPVHTDNPELNQISMAHGKSQTFTVKKVGTWGYHNHLNSSDSGTLIIQ